LPKVKRLTAHRLASSNSLATALSNRYRCDSVLGQSPERVKAQNAPSWRGQNDTSWQASVGATVRLRPTRSQLSRPVAVAPDVSRPQIDARPGSFILSAGRCRAGCFLVLGKAGLTHGDAGHSLASLAPSPAPRRGDYDALTDPSQLHFRSGWRAIGRYPFTD
jgi:hypothetical protein